MSVTSTRRLFAVVLVTLLLLSLSVPVWADGWRIKGSVGAKAYGYTDADETEHLWLMNTTTLTVQKKGFPLQLHMAGNYLGDNGDDFSESSKGRLLKGYLQYGCPYDMTYARAGRFFLWRGVGFGVVDGLEVSQVIGKNVRATVYGGLMGPMNRQFELEDSEDAQAFGGEVKIRPSKCFIADEGLAALSYTHQTRGDEVIRNRVGLQTIHKWGHKLTWMNILHMRLEGDALRKYQSRLKYHSDTWFGHVEAGVANPDVADYSLYADFLHSYGRARFSLNRWFVENKWGAGIDGGALLVSNGNGFRVGPVVTTPYGEVGYRADFGDRSNSSGPWVSLRYSVMRDLHLYANGSMVTYEWEEMDMESEDLVMANAGARYVVGQTGLIAFGEFQVYKTPQFTQDRRGLLGFNWRFDTRRAK